MCDVCDLMCACCRPLSAQGIASVVDVMDAYSLTKADYDAITDLTKFKSKAGWAADPTKELTAVVKSAFTREVNKSASSRRARSSFMLPETAVGKKRGRKAATVAADDVPLDAGVAGMEVDEGVVEDVVDTVPAAADDDDDDDDEQVRAKKKAMLAANGVNIVEKAPPAKKGAGAKKAGASSGQGGNARGRGRGK